MHFLRGSVQDDKHDGARSEATRRVKMRKGKFRLVNKSKAGAAVKPSG